MYLAHSFPIIFHRQLAMIQPDQQVQTQTSRIICKQKNTKELADNFF